MSDLPRPLSLPPSALLSTYDNVNALAPLVRCSKLPFRHLCSLYETHITHTPMILAQEFSRAQVARIADFSTSSEERGVFWMEPTASGSGSGSSSRPNPEDGLAFINQEQTRGGGEGGRFAERRQPSTLDPPTKHSELVRGCLIAQFASPNATALADAAELISPYVDGIDLNCGCPQGWAYKEGIGCALLRKPELVRDMVRAVKGRLGWDYGISVKIRVDPDLKLTEQLVQTAVQAGASHITIHGRTRHQPSTHPVSLDGIRFAVECAKGAVPCMGNGDIWELDDAHKMRKETGVRGVMGARGLLANPALFAGHKETPIPAVEQFVRLSVDYGLLFPLFHRHLAYMLESRFVKPERTYFNSLASTVATVEYLQHRGLDCFTDGKDDQPVKLWEATQTHQHASTGVPA